MAKKPDAKAVLQGKIAATEHNLLVGLLQKESAERVIEQARNQLGALHSALEGIEPPKEPEKKKGE